MEGSTNMSEQIKKTELSNAQENALKSFTTGYGITPETQVNAGALRREFLDDQITMLTWTENDLVFYKEITRRPSESTVAKYDQYLSHGRVGHSRFTTEIGVAPVSDPSIRQKTVQMKFVSDTKNMSIASGLVNNIADPAQILTDDAIAVVAKTIEWASFYGDADLSANPDTGSGLEFDGLVKLIDKNNIIDARGKSLDEQLLNQAAVVIGKGFGTPTDAFMPLGVQADFVNQQLSRQVQVMRDNNNNVTTGYNVQRFQSARGLINLHGSTVMELEQILDVNAPIAPTAPAKPTATAKANVKSGKDVGAFFKEDIDAGLTYVVTVSSDDAQSAPSDEVTVTLANETDFVELEIAFNPLFQQTPQFVSIYRKGKETGLFYLIDRVATSKAEGNTLTYVDKNAKIPETADVFVGEMSPQVLHLFELLPMMRLPLAQVNASITFAVLWYGALALRAPKKFVRIKNVKYVATGNVF